MLTAARHGTGAYLARFSLAGAWTALAWFCFATTPSLLPRTWLYQAVVSGLSIVVGYATGVLAVALWRRLGFSTRLSPRARRLSRQLLGAAALVAVPTFLALGARWQDETREWFGMPSAGPWHGVRQLVVALAIALTVLQVARGQRWLTRRWAARLSRRLPLRVARLAAVLAVAVVSVALLNGGVVQRVLDTLNDTYALSDGTTPDGVEPPTEPERSGSPASSSAWDTLGRQGRAFVGTGPDVDAIAAFTESTGRVAATREPIRVYAGLDAAVTLESAAELVVAELDRTDAWEREVLVVATTTGTGWIDPSAAAAIELLHDGDTAIAAMQYSYLPSWVSFVVDRSTPPEAGGALFEAVYDAWEDRPADDRPRLVVFGLSLGSYGSQGAFASLQDVTTRTDGALWVGTPRFTEEWAALTAARDPGSPEVAPVLDEGRTVRWGTTAGTAADLLDPPAEWEHPRVVYLQHPSDAVVWWSPDLAFSRPDWLREDGTGYRPPSMSWLPVVTFVQVTMDMLVAGDVPPGYGHNYRTEYAMGWAQVAPPEGWTDADTAALIEALS